MLRTGAVKAGLFRFVTILRTSIAVFLCLLLWGPSDLPAAGNVDREMELARKHLRLHRWDRALREVQDVLDAQPRNTDAWLIKAEAHLGQQDNNAALAAYIEAAKLNPDDVDVRIRIGDLLLRRNDRLSDALQIYEQILEDDPANARVRVAMGSIYERRRQWEAAADAYRAALHIDPNLVRARSNLGAVLFKQGDYAGSSRELRKAIELSPRDLRSHVFLGLSQNHLGRYDVALQGLKDALLIDPHAANQLIGVADQLPQFHRLTHVLQHAYQESPREAGRSYDLAVIYFYARNYDEAWRFLIRAENFRYPVPIELKEVVYSRRRLDLFQR